MGHSSRVLSGVKVSGVVGLRSHQQSVGRRCQHQYQNRAGAGRPPSFIRRVLPKRFSQNDSTKRLTRAKLSECEYKV